MIYFLKSRKSIARIKERSVICQHSCLIMMRTSTMLGILKVPYSRWFWVLYLTRTHSLSRRMIRFDAQAFEQILPIFFEMPKVWHLFCLEILSMQLFIEHLINVVVKDCFFRTTALDFYNYGYLLLFFISIDTINNT